MGTDIIASYLGRYKGDIMRTLPANVDFNRFGQIVLTEIRKSDLAKQNGTATTSLSDCSPESLLGCVLTAATVGLEIGVNGESYMVPYKNHGRAEAQLIIGYQGLAKLAFQHPMVKGIDARAVYPEDVFEISYGTTPTITHIPAQKRDPKSQPVSYYAVVTLSSGAQIIESLTAAEVKELRRGKVGSSGDIKDPQHWMERKTVLRQALKLAPKSTSVHRALQAEDDPESTVFKPREPMVRAEVISHETGEILTPDTPASAEGQDSLVAG